MSAPQPSPAIGEITAFSTFLQKVEEGQLHADLSRAVEEIVANLNDAYAEARGKPKATLSLKLDFIKDGESIDV
ncbi:MAG: hypothetical protein K2Q10_07265, partial [Rhodospirillales bacterium]|nr:hypothetical protein [Rhodospirillales bacterium]